MKALLGMAREKRENSGQQFKPLSKLNLKKQEPQPSSYLDDEEQEDDYEPDEEQIIAYAEYLGIKLPEEEDLLFIARQGLMADLPPDWANEEADDGNIIYTNLRTGEKTFEHPCDEYYRALVIKERRKNGTQVNKYAAGVQPIGMAMHQQQPVRKDIDPLVKMEMEKKKKKMEEQKKKQFEDRKKQIKERFDRKKNELEKQLKEKQDKIKKRYDEEIEGERSKLQKKMTQNQRQQEEKNKRELQKFERETRAKLEKKLHDKISEEKKKIEKAMKVKREQIRVNLQNELKRAKKDLEEQQKSRIQILAEKDKVISVKKSEHEMIEEQKAQIRDQFIQRKLQQNSEQIQAVKAEQEEQYRIKLAKLESDYEEKVKKLETDAPKQHIKFDGIIKEIEEEQREEMKSFEYELDMLRELKKAENEEKLQNFKHQFWRNKKQELDRLERQKEANIQKYRRVKEEEFLNRLGEQQKKIKQQYLNSIKVLKSKYEKEEEMIELEGREKKHDGFMEKESIEMMDQVVDKLSWKEQNLKRQIESLREEVRKLSKDVKPVKYRLNEEQLRMYNCIKQCLERQK